VVLTNHLIARTRVREFFGRFLLAGSYALPIGAAVAALAALAHSLGLLGAGRTIGALDAIAGLTVAVAITFAAFGLSTRRLSRLLDQRGELKDRLTNALDFGRRAQRSPLMELAIADAEDAAAGVRPGALIPLWSRGHTKRVAMLLLLLPLLYLAAAIDLASLFKTPPRPEFAGVVPPTLPAELAEDGFRELPGAGVMLPALANLRGLIGDWRARLTELREKAREAAAKEPQKEPELPETIYRETPKGEAAKAPRILGADGLPAVRNSDRLHPSDARALGDVDPNIDSSMRMAFSQLDESFLDKDPHLTATMELSKSMADQAVKADYGGQELAMADSFGGSPMAHNQGTGVDRDHEAIFRDATHAAQTQSMAEFLHEYAKHLARLVQAKEDVLDEKKQQQKDNPNQTPQNALAADQGQQLPPNAQLRMVEPTDDMNRGVKLTNDVGNQVQPGATMRAGQGGGTFRGAIKVKHEETPSQGPKEMLAGQLGDGKSSVQIFEDAEAGNAGALSALMRVFQADAQERLQDQTIPVSVRAYVQRYLQSISPDQMPGLK